MFLVVAVMIL